MDLLAPLRCPGCNDPVQPSAGSAGFVDFCDVCTEQLEPSDHPHATHTHIGPMARAIQRFKYEGRPELARTLAHHSGALLIDAIGAVDRVVPIPLHRSRRIERGYDQAALLGRELARLADLPLDLDCLRRVRSTGHQVGRTREERRAAMRSAFAASSLVGARVLLVDDVVTTGATFDAAEAACRGAGATLVHRLAITAPPA